MSHIAFDLDALPLVPKVARSAGIGEAVVGWGLTQMWEWCWREKTDRVTTNHLRGFFGAELGAILVDFGFLEAVGSSLWRVRGAARYLRITAAQSEAGKKHAGNLKKGPKKKAQKPRGEPGSLSRLGPGLEPGVSREGAGGEPGHVPGSTATSDERLAKEEEEEPARPRVLSDRLVATFFELRRTPYKFASSTDGPALARLMKATDDNGEVDRRWRIGLNNLRWPQVNTIAQLDSKWNDLTAPSLGGNAPTESLSL